jgi:hypothetical protein
MNDARIKRVWQVDDHILAMRGTRRIVRNPRFINNLQLRSKPVCWGLDLT